MPWKSPWAFLTPSENFRPGCADPVFYVNGVRRVREKRSWSNAKETLTFHIRKSDQKKKNIPPLGFELAPLSRLFIYSHKDAATEEAEERRERETSARLKIVGRKNGGTERRRRRVGREARSGRRSGSGRGGSRHRTQGRLCRQRRSDPERRYCVARN
jgi:hypothetical protein